MQLPIQTQPIDRHHRNGLSNIQLSGVTPSLNWIYKIYETSDCTGGSVGQSNQNPCWDDISGSLSYRKKLSGTPFWGSCKTCRVFQDDD